MIKAKTNNNDMLIGLSDENIKRLTNNQPIKVDIGEVYPEIPELQGKVCLIIHGKTETDIVKSLPLGPSTKINT
tara:strand:- start:280 stop:501 length:222 start_codon:yes stop_codon:yes gene_type:complete